MSYKDSKSTPFVLGLLAVFLWSTSSVVAKLAETSVGYIALTTSMFLIGFIVFLGITYSNIPIKEKLMLLSEKNQLKPYLLYSAATGLFMGVYYYTYYFSIQSPYSVQANLINYLWPTLTPFLAAAVFKSSKPIDKNSVIALLISFIGCAIVVTGFSLSSFTITIYHIAAFIAALTASLYMNFAMLAEDIFDNLPLTYTVALGAALPFVIMSVFTQPLTIEPTLRTGGFILYVSIFTFVMANLAWTRSLIEGNTARISSLAYLIPIFSTVLLAIIEPPDTTLSAIIVGGGLILLGQILTTE